MKTFLRVRKRLALVLGAALVAGLLAAAAAYALTAKSFRYGEPKTGYVRVSHMAFTANADFVTWGQSLTDGLSTRGGNGCFNAGVDLPVGSKVKSVTWYYRSGPASDIETAFHVNRLARGIGSRVIGPFSPIEDSDTPTSLTIDVPSNKQLVTAGRAYWVEVCPGSDGAFFGARVKFTYTSAGS
jgi:hypothetical protein